jgi:hypothetical protein
LHGDGTNGAQNNTFVDSSTNNFTITRNGNTTQGSFSPYGSNWSNFFNGSNTYLSYPNSSTMQLGAGNFTIEAWCYFNVVQESTIIARYPFDSTNNEWIFGAGSTLIPSFSYTTGGNTVAGSVGPNTALALNTWHHIAVVRNSSTLTMYVNGTSVATSSISATIYAGTTASTVGTYAQSSFPAGYAVPNGYLSNVRVVKGTAVYTSNFTPSTTPLTAISGTSLLTCQSNRFVDNSTNAFAVTVNGTPSVQRFNPFGTATAYSTSVIGGSGYFDGSGDYLEVSANSFSTSGTWTIEAWVYLTFDLNNDYIVNGLSSDRLYIQWAGTTFLVGDASANNIVVSNSKPLNQWLHVAVVKNGSTYTAYFNGVSIGTSTTALISTTLTTWQIAARSSNSSFTKGYMSDLRIVNGTAVYTSNFTPPTAPLTTITNTSLLTKFQNAAIFDNAMINDLETVGNAQISTSVVKYGTGSMYFDGTGDALRSQNTPNLQFSTGDFTVECWLYQTATNTYPSILEIGNHVGDSGGMLFIASNGSTITAYNGSAGFLGTATAPSLNTWNHIAWVRNNGTFKIYVNGVGNTGVSFTTNLNVSTAVTIGADQFLNSSYTYTGYIDDLRITKGFARYTANFTAPTAAFPNTGPV